jgi:hypothetical protein
MLLEDYCIASDVGIFVTILTRHALHSELSRLGTQAAQLDVVK